MIRSPILIFQPFETLPTLFVTATHQTLMRPQDAMAIWVEDLHKNNFTICLRETKILDGTHENIKIVSHSKFLSIFGQNTRCLI